MMAYSGTVDGTDKYLRLGESIALESLTSFCEEMDYCYGAVYLQLENAEDTEMLREGDEFNLNTSYLCKHDCKVLIIAWELGGHVDQ